MTATNPTPLRENLAEASRRLRDDLALQTPPRAVHDAVRAAWSATRVAEGQAVAPPVWRPAPATGAAVLPPARARYAGWAAAACAALLLASTALLLLEAPTDTARALAARTEPAFVPVAGAERWPAPAGGSAQAAAPAWLVAAELPRERLAQWGLPFDPSRAGEPVRAELLLRASGEVLAVRVVHGAAGR